MQIVVEVEGEGEDVGVDVVVVEEEVVVEVAAQHLEDIIIIIIIKTTTMSGLITTTTTTTTTLQLAHLHLQIRQVQHNNVVEKVVKKHLVQCINKNSVMQN